MPAPSAEPSPADASSAAIASSTTSGSTSASMLNRGGVREKAMHDEIEMVEDGATLKDLKRERDERSVFSGIGEGSAEQREGEGAPLTARDKRALALLVALCSALEGEPEPE